jgi:hypothetical protein
MFSPHVALAALKGIRHATEEVNEVGNRGTKMAGKQIASLICVSYIGRLQTKLTHNVNHRYGFFTSTIQQVASDQSKWAFERARAAALFLEDTMDSGR